MYCCLNDGKCAGFSLLSATLGMYTFAVISCGIDHQLQSAIITNTLSQCTKNLLAICITDKISVENMEWVCSTCHSNLSNGKLPICSEARVVQYICVCS